jgi:hypothetical protein
MKLYCYIIITYIIPKSKEMHGIYNVSQVDFSKNL